MVELSDELRQFLDASPVGVLATRPVLRIDRRQPARARARSRLSS
jgi:hypothetical protein